MNTNSAGPPHLRVVDGETKKTPALRGAWTADQLMAAQFPDPRWAVPGLLAEGSRVVDRDRHHAAARHPGVQGGHHHRLSGLGGGGASCRRGADR